MQTPHDDLVGQTIKGFLVRSIIDTGGMARVYLATQLSVNREVAFKVIRLGEDTPTSTDFRRRFAQEAALVASLEHPNIVTIFDYGIEDLPHSDVKVAFIAMRLLQGGTLSRYMATAEEGQPLPLARTVALFEQIASGLAYAHNKGILHRDLKPNNILLDEHGTAYLTDFGLARPIHTVTTVTQADSIVGTPIYMSPEQLRGERLDHRSDIYSAGVMLYQMLTGAPPFVGDSSSFVTLIYEHLERVPIAPSQSYAGIPPLLDQVVLRALAKKPDDRFSSMGEMFQEVSRAVGNTLPTGQFPAPNIPQTQQPAVGWRRRLVPAAALVLVVLGAAVALIVSARSREMPDPVVLIDTSVDSREIAPDAALQRRARAALGADGFIGLIACNRTSQYHAAITREIIEFAEAYGLRVRTYDSDSSPVRQAPLIETARAEGAVGLMICPLDSDAIDPVLREIDAADLPLVLFDSPNDEHYGGVVKRGDSYSLGYVPGSYAGALIRDERGGQANVVILDYPDLPSVVLRANGMEDGVLAVAPEATIVGRYLGGTQEAGYESVKGLIDAGVAFDVIVSINDAGSYGAVQALEEADIAPDAVIIVSVDAEAQAQAYIRDGIYLRGSMGVTRTEAAQGMVDAMVTLLGGGTIPETIIIFADENSMVTRETLPD